MRLRALSLSLLLVACGADPEPLPAAPESASPAPEAPAAPIDLGLAEGDGVASELAKIDITLAAGAKRSETQPTDWSGFDAIARARMRRARLSGDYGDYAAAEAAIAEAFERAPEGGGPYVLRAKLNATLHRLDRVEADLDRVKDVPTAGLHSAPEAVLVRASVAAQRGDLDTAKRLYNDAIPMIRPPVTPLAGLARMHWLSGDFESADGLYSDIIALFKGKVGEPLAWTHLQRGLIDLDTGRYEDALAHYNAADAILPGWWLIHEHIAEIALLLGERDKAAAIYDKVIADTDGAPEFLDARAAMLLEDGQEAEAKAMIARSRAAYEERLKAFPEATWGHALDHFLEFGPKERALELAEANYALRPNGDAAGGLIEARLQNGKVAEAVALADAIGAGPWRIADLHAARMAAYEAGGRADDAAAQKAAALAINPRVLD